MAGSRTKARKRALDVLFESELQSRSVGATLDGRVAAGDPPVNPYTIELVEGVREHRDRIDALLSEYAQGWTLDRMPAVDRNLLRIGAYEVLYRDDVPDAVAVSEAANLAAELSTDESPTFVRGLLTRLVEVKPTLPA
ncbi:transcription antitermination factor NusB [Mumia zhuanghuii]|jgi:N utilization substance protein B|uniref:Transcription antitermination protein NusB n=1 Tax=Mumia zhuanghuii TaxID=2585211 RepID=A0A5C4MB70_9ACTN|nr:transcription antitermination factor NusB [Mumia zhuanghuii]TNC29863.1 transcription antitermination factor NusB [Mumia zhuanghuii]TNC37088.1 transcription antitermination factor NusB [Mumia zhuanghuii]